MNKEKLGGLFFMCRLKRLRWRRRLKRKLSSRWRLKRGTTGTKTRKKTLA
jgi:hypothetical protein